MIGVYSTQAHTEKELTFSLDIAKRAIEFYRLYQTPYRCRNHCSWPCLTSQPVPWKTGVGNLEAYLLLDPDSTTLEMKKLVATVVTHELAQWFGDLVTMEWWDNLWLNESFANMMESYQLTTWNLTGIWEMFQTSEAAAALTRDATDGVQSVHVEVNDPAEIDALFDGAIVYAKGSRMLVMVRSLLGDEALRKGLKRYFDEHKFGNAAGDDLWDAL